MADIRQPNRVQRNSMSAPSSAHPRAQSAHHGVDCRLCKFHRRIADAALVVGCHGGHHATGSASFGCIIYLVVTGVGVWGNNVPVGWAWDITNFVSGSVRSRRNTDFRDSLLTRQKWRTSINRAAEAMTLFAVICAAIYPGFHIGRVWMAWFMAPVPNSNGIWPNFEVRCFGTFSRSAPTSLFRCCFGIRA